MKKLSLVVGGFLVLSSNVFAHQISGEFHDSFWNWNNGSHFTKMIKDSAGGNAVVDMNHNYHTHADGTTHSNTANKANDMMNQKSKNEPIFDTGIQPSNSK